MGSHSKTVFLYSNLMVRNRFLESPGGRIGGMTEPSAKPCLCGTALPYAACCGRFHAGTQPVPNAEALMRSRYSAYVLGLNDYLLASWHASTRPAPISLSLTVDEPRLKWLGLEVRRHAVQDAEHATVEFVARSKLAGRAQRMHEVSRFVREGGCWFYVDGEVD